MNEKLCEITIENDSYGIRIDKVIADKCNISRTKAQNLITSVCVYLHSSVMKNCHYLVKINESYKIFIPKVSELNSLPSYDIPLTIIFEDEDILIIDKPPGLVVHGGAGTKNDTLINALASYQKNNEFHFRENLRYGIVHRLDKDTSGIMIVAKHDRSHGILSQAFAEHAIKKEYLTVVWGHISQSSGVITNNIAPKRHNKQIMTVVNHQGKVAITEYKVKKYLSKATLLQCFPKTGRTHQLRVQLSHLGHSIIGDQKYGKNSIKAAKYFPNNSFVCNFNRQALHAHKLNLLHPINNTYIEFFCKIPADIQHLIDSLDYF